MNACFVCFGNHPQQKCPNKKPCSLCGSEKHHFLLCKSGKKKESLNITGQDQTVSAPRKEEDQQIDHCAHAESASHATKGAGLALYPIQQAKVCESGKNVTIFCDGGSNTTYITHQAADRIKAKKLNRFTLDVTTMGNVEKTYNTRQYQFTLRTDTGKKVSITAFGMDRITGSVSKLDTKILANLFPGYDVDSLQRKTDKVDILLGCDYFGLFPKCEEAKCGDNLSIMKGDFGVCLQGTHPDLKEGTEHDSNLVKTIHNSVIKHEVYHVCHVTHPEFQPNCSNPGKLVDVNEGYACHRQTNVAESITGRTQGRLIENFICGEEIGTEITPRCGSCRCGKCPTVGHTYSFNEEQELKMIQENLEYDSVKQCWVTSYPWLVDPGTLPNNYGSALATLKNTERTLSKDERWADTYLKQMEDMVERGVARKLPQKELQDWNGPKFYIFHLAVVNTRSHSTPVRIVFNSSQVCQGMSLNSCLAKGPDCYMNNMIGILLRWREEQVALVGDIRKMFHSIHLKPLEQHCHRFLWRDLETDQEPDVYVMTRVNMGDTPAPAINTEAVYKTADMFEADSPKAANLLKRSSYVEDLIDSQPSPPEALKIARETEDMLGKGGFVVKCWQFSGEPSPRTGKMLSVSDDTIVEPDGTERTHTNMLKGNAMQVTAQHLKEAEDFVVKNIQRTIECELKKRNSKKGNGGHYAKLKPVQDASGIWVIGERLNRYNAMTPDSSLQRLLPSKHPATRLFMQRAHQAGGHRGRDATLARFRMHYWTPQGSKLARLVKTNCQLCKLRDAKFLEQPMGLLPEARLKPAPAFNHVMLDLFGPYTVRGEVQKRTSGKAYGVLFTDLTMRAVHIEAVFGYDTSNFLMALSRFASLRGWPEKIYSDPGSQLVGAERKLKEAWQRIDRESLQRDSAQNGSTWVFGPADSPWHQGAVESLIKAAKRAIHFSVSNQRLSVPEFLTVCCEVANLLNERPIGVKPSVDSVINALTPNSLILGRATASNPMGWQPYETNIATRCHLVQSVVEDFWKRWTELYAPALVVQRKWHTATRNLRPGDVVIVADKNTLRGEYRLALVRDVFPGEDGRVRKVTVQYKSYRTGEKVHEYRGARDTVVSRAVQRLALLVPVD